MASSIAFSQVGIGTTNPDSNSILDLTSTNKGFLLPRVALISKTNPLPVNATAASIPLGLIVLNTTTNATAGQELNPNQLYKWSGTQWDELVDLAKVTDLVDQALGTLNVPKQVLSTNVSGTQAKGGNPAFPSLVVEFPIELSDVDNAFNGTVYTVPQTTTYVLSSQIACRKVLTHQGGSTWYGLLELQRSTNNGASWVRIMSDTRSGLNPTDEDNGNIVTWSGNLNAGDRIRLLYTSNINSADNEIKLGSFTVTKL